MPEGKPKRMIKEIVQEAKRQQKLPALVEGLKKDIEKAKMSKEEIREIYDRIPFRVIDEMKSKAKKIGAKPSVENVVALYVQSSQKSEAQKMQDPEKKEMERLLVNFYYDADNDANARSAISSCISRFENKWTIRILEKLMLGFSGPGCAKSMSDSFNCVSRYGKYPELAVVVAERLGQVGLHARIGKKASDAEKAVSDAAGVLSSDAAFDCITKRSGKPEMAREISNIMLSLKESQIDDFTNNIQKVAEGIKAGYNIDFFGRYPWHVIKGMHENMGQKAVKPLALLIYAKNDHNGTFYTDIGLLSKISQFYDVRIIEIAKEQELAPLLDRMKKFGKADFLVIAGHGEPKTIQLGKEEDEKIDVAYDTSVFDTLGGAINKGAQVALFSCSTGDTSTTGCIAEIASRFLESSTIFAPNKPAGPEDINIELDRKTRRPIVKEVVFSKGAEMVFGNAAKEIPARGKIPQGSKEKPYKSESPQESMASKTVLQDPIGQEIKQLQGPDKFSHFKNYIMTEDGRKTLTSLLKSIEGRKAVLNLLRETEGATKTFNEIFKTSQGRETTAKFMKSEEGRRVLADLTTTVDGGKTIKNLYRTFDGKKVVGSLLLDKEGRKTAFAIVAYTTFRKINEEKPLPEYTPTESGGKFKSYFISEEGKKELMSKISAGEGREETAKFLRTPEAVAVFRDIMKTAEGRKRIVELMKSDSGRELMKNLAGTKEGLELITDGLWNTDNGRKVVQELIKTKEGQMTILETIAHQGIINQAIILIIGKEKFLEVMSDVGKGMEIYQTPAK